MTTELKREGTPRIKLALPNPRPDRTVMPRRTVLEIKRAISKKLSVRLHQDCFSS